MSDHLDSFDAELNQSQFFRMFALGCFDSLITLPISLMTLVVNIAGNGPRFKFYQGWTAIHSGWEPLIVPKSIWSTSKWVVVSVHWDEWISPFWALVFFSLFGLTSEARQGYRGLFQFIGRPFGIKQRANTEEGLPDVVFQSGRGTNATLASNISSRYVLGILPARKYNSIPCSSPQADASV